MDMSVKILFFTVGMQDRDYARPNVIFIFHPVFEGFSRSLHLHIKQDKFISFDKPVKLVRYGKDHVSVRYPEHISSNLFSPSYRVSPAAGGAEAVFTVVEYVGCLSTLRTS